MIKLKLKILFLSILISQFACEFKRDALGADNEIRVICSEIDRDIVESYLKQIFIDTIFSPEPEPYYYLKFSEPESYNKLKKQAKIVVAAVNRGAGNPGIKLINKILPKNQFEDMIENDPIILAKDVYANNQLFMVINASSSNQLIETIKIKKNFFRQTFHDEFVKKQKKYIFGEDRNKGIEDTLSTYFGWKMKIPWGWININKTIDSNFVWLGKEMPFQWIGVSWSEGNLISQMNTLEVGEYLWSWPKIFYKNIQFNEYKFKLNETSFNGYTSWRAVGIWETINKKESKGGPFCSYLFFNKILNKTFHINYLLHNPGKDKSIHMRQMDLIIKSFTISPS